jgi:hypothetical protein
MMSPLLFELLGIMYSLFIMLVSPLLGRFLGRIIPRTAKLWSRLFFFAGFCGVLISLVRLLLVIWNNQGMG